jgi:hypothetical protein
LWSFRIFDCSWAVQQWKTFQVNFCRQSQVIMI